MAKFFHAGVETNEENDDGMATTLYFEGVPTEDEVKKTCSDLDVHKFHLIERPDPDSEFFGFGTYPTPVSKKAGLTRVQVFS